jgi:hypothetical protein
VQAQGGMHLSGTRTVLSFQGGLLALKACQRLGLARARLVRSKDLDASGRGDWSRAARDRNGTQQSDCGLG